MSTTQRPIGANDERIPGAAGPVEAPTDLGSGRGAAGLHPVVPCSPPGVPGEGTIPPSGSVSHGIFCPETRARRASVSVDGWRRIRWAEAEVIIGLGRNALERFAHDELARLNPDMRRDERRAAMAGRGVSFHRGGYEIRINRPARNYAIRVRAIAR